jgi:hypothetical protein
VERGDLFNVKHDFSSSVMVYRRRRSTMVGMSCFIAASVPQATNIRPTNIRNAYPQNEIPRNGDSLGRRSTLWTSFVVNLFYT